MLCKGRVLAFRTMWLRTGAGRAAAESGVGVGCGRNLRASRSVHMMHGNIVATSTENTEYGVLYSGA